VQIFPPCFGPQQTLNLGFLLQMSEPGSVSDFPLALLPNPATPLAFLPLNIADTVQVAAYVIVGSTGVSAYVLDSVFDLHRFLGRSLLINRCFSGIFL